MEPRNVFLSWTRSDEDAKNAVKNYLEAKGITCLDSADRCVGDFLEWSIEAARMDGVFLLILSKNISSESVVLKEVAEALKMPDAKKRFLIVSDDDEIYNTFMGGKLTQLNATFAKFKRGNNDSKKTVYLENMLEEIAKKVQIAMGDLGFNVYRENRFPREISLVGADNKSVSFERLYLDRIITEMENGEEKGKINSPKELMEKDGLYFLYGPGGSGKSLYIDQICREAGDTLVIKLSCPDVVKKDSGTIYDQMFEEVKVHMGGRTYFTDANFKAMIIEHRLLLVLDGMDELSTSNARDEFLKKAKVFCDANREKTGVLFTSRSERDAEIVSFGSIRMFRMDKLTDEEIHRLGKNAFLEFGSERDQDTFFVQVSDLSEEIRCNPLLLTQLAFIYGNGEEIPDDIVGIFDKVSDIILREPDNATPPYDELNGDNIGGLLKQFAYEKYNNPQETDVNVFSSILRSKYHGNAPTIAKKCLKYLQERSIYVEGKFLHKMLLEYFTAVSYYEEIFNDYGRFMAGKKLKELFSHYRDTYWTDMIRLFLIKSDNEAKDMALETLYEEILKGDITEYTLLLDTATKFLKRKNIPTEAVCLDILRKSTSGEYPAYGPLFWYIPEYNLYEALAKATEQMKGDYKALALTRDVCVLNGKYTLSEVTDTVDGERLFASGKNGLSGTRLALCDLFYTGNTEEKGEEVYPRLFDLAETKALMTGGCGFCGRREKLFKDELGLYTPTKLPLLGDEYIGFITIPNDKEVTEAELKKYLCKKVRAVAFMNTEKETFGYINFYRRNVKHLYLPENVLGLEEYWKNFLILDRKVLFENNGIWYRDLYRKSYIIPQGVTKIGNKEYKNNNTIIEIHLPDGLNEIGEGAFSGCTSLTEVFLPEGLKIIDWRAFEGCSSLTEIRLPKGLQVIGDAAFEGCSRLAEINLPEGLQEIGGNAFSGCTSLTEIYLPEGLKEIAWCAFKDCSGVTEIYFPEGLQVIGRGAFLGCTSVKKISIPFSLNQKGFFLKVHGLLSGVHIVVRKDGIDWSNITSYYFPEGVEKIDDGYFQDCKNLKRVQLPNTLKEIGDYSFARCTSLTEINLPYDLEEIGIGAFSGCSRLEEINLPVGLKKIERCAFEGCSSLTEIYLYDYLQEIGEDAFSGCSSLTKISLPFYVKLTGLPSNVHIVARKNKIEWSKITSYHFQEGVEKIDEGYFKDCKKLVEVLLPESLKEIQSEAFSGCSSLSELQLPESLQEIGRSVFKGCSSLTKINLPEKLRGIGDKAFYGCSRLTEINLPEGVKEIGESAFANCTSLTRINLPEGIKKIGKSAFYRCSRLKEIHLPDGLQEIGEGIFEGCSSLTKIHLPQGIKKIEGKTFSGCSSLTEINLPQGIQEIKERAFSGCSRINEIHLPEGVKEIGGYAFADCYSLVEIHLPEGIQWIKQGSFEGCSSLSKIHLPEILQKIEAWAFSGCSRLSEINLPNGLQIIGKSAFKGCISLVKIHLPEVLDEIGGGAFSGCNSLTEINLPEKLQVIVGETFKRCSSLAEINLPDGLQEIGLEAFSGCVLLQEIHIPTSVMEIKNGAFKDCTSLQKVVISRNFEMDIERIFGEINREIVEFID